MIWVCPSSLSHHQKLASYFHRYHGFILDASTCVLTLLVTRQSLQSNGLVYIVDWIGVGLGHILSFSKKAAAYMYASQVHKMLKL
jgi:hypothetical protein